MSIKNDIVSNGNIYFISLGCSKNQVDSEVMLAVLLLGKFNLVDTPETADYCIVNTCGFIRDAIDESSNLIKKLSRIKKQKNSKIKKIIVVGCLVERFGFEKIKQKFNDVDCFVDVNSPEKLAAALTNDVDIVKSESLYLMDENTPRIIINYPHIAYLKISEGCSNSCSFCTIPSIRGRFRSRPVKSILNELINLQKLGIKEVILISQDTTFYGKDLKPESDLLGLLTKIEKLKLSIPWIRLLYLNPDRFDDELITFIKESKSILPYFDIPIQHVSDKILKSMRRSSNLEDTKRIFNQIKELIPDSTIRTTFIVGFPGESEADFQELVDFVERTEIDRVGIFKYSDEEGTIAFNLKNKVPAPLIAVRYNYLIGICEQKLRSKNSSLIGKTLEVMVDDKFDERYLARTRSDAPDIDLKVYFTSNKIFDPGELVEVIVTDADGVSIYVKEVGVRK